MEDILSLALVFIFYIIALASDKKRKKKRQARRERAKKQEDIRDLLQEAEELVQDVQSRYGAEATRADAQRKPAAQQSCREQRIHLHEATQAQMRFAAEGEDPCHHGEASLLNDETDDVMDSPIYAQETDADRQQLAQDMLRGVIMSEILTRPCAGRSMQKNRRRVS